MELFFLYNCIFLLVLYVTGSLILFVLNRKPSKPYSALFTQIMVGIIFYVVLFSIIKTTGNTINLGFILMAIPMILSLNPQFISERRHPSNYFAISKEVILTSVVLLITIFTICYWSISEPGFTIPVIPDTDYVYYSRISDYLNRFGIESGIPDYIHPEQNNVVPYHYFELWFNAILINITGALSILLQQLSVHVILNLLLCTGFLAICENYTRVGLREKLFSILFLFFNGLVFYYYPEKLLHPNYAMFLTNVITTQKSAVVLLFLLAALLFFINQKPEQAIYSLLALPICSINTAPATFVSVFAWIILSFFCRSGNQNLIRTGVFTVCLLIFFVLFYALNNNPVVISSFSDWTSLKNIYHQQPVTLISFLNRIGKSILQLIYIFSPFLLIMTIYYKTILSGIFKKTEIWLPVFLVLSSIMAWSAMSPLLDSIQLFTNLSIPLVNLILFILFHFLLFKTNRKSVQTLLFCFFFIWIAVNIKNTVESRIRSKIEYKQTYSAGYLSEVHIHLPKTGTIGGILFSPDHLKNLSSAELFIFCKKLDAFGYRNFLSGMRNGLDVVALHEKNEIPLSADPAIRIQEESLLEKQHFQQFIKEQKQKKTYFRTDQSRIEFINSMDIHYLFVSPGTLIDSTLQQLIISKVTDSLSGEMFLVLR